MRSMRLAANLAFGPPSSTGKSGKTQSARAERFPFALDHSVLKKITVENSENCFLAWKGH
jgi:hypothetical protein